MGGERVKQGQVFVLVAAVAAAAVVAAVAVVV
jgi:hypothetical protein